MKRLIERFGYYEDHIRQLAECRLDEEPKAKDFKIPTRIQQTAYREIRKYDFRGNLVDYLAWTAGLFVLHQWLDSLDRLEHRPITNKEARSVLNRVMEQFPLDGYLLLRACGIYCVRDISGLRTRIRDWDAGGLILDSLADLYQTRYMVLKCKSREEIAQVLTNKGLEAIIKVVVKTQGLAPVIDTSPTNPQSTNKQTNQPPATTRAKGHKAANPVSRVR